MHFGLWIYGLDSAQDFKYKIGWLGVSRGVSDVGESAFCRSYEGLMCLVVQLLVTG